MSDQPRDIHGNLIYLGDRVAVATMDDTAWPELIVRRVESVDSGCLRFPEVDGFVGRVEACDVSHTVLRLL